MHQLDINLTDLSSINPWLLLSLYFWIESLYLCQSAVYIGILRAQGPPEEFKSHLYVAEGFVKVVHCEADEGVGHLLTLRLGVHPPVGGRGPHLRAGVSQALLYPWQVKLVMKKYVMMTTCIQAYFCRSKSTDLLSGPPEHLQVRGGCPRADRQGDLGLKYRLSPNIGTKTV